MRGAVWDWFGVTGAHRTRALSCRSSRASIAANRRRRSRPQLRGVADRLEQLRRQ